MAKRKQVPPIFDDTGMVGTGLAQGSEIPDPVYACLDSSNVRKVKAGYYLPVDLLDQLDRAYLTLRLNREPVQSKSQLVEIALGLLLNDLEQGDKSTVLQKLRNEF